MATTTILNVAFFGPSGAGKSELVKRLTNQRYKYQTKHEQTIGVEFARINVSKSDSILLWDTAGLERYINLLKGYIGGAGKLCLVIPANMILDRDQINQFIATLPGKIQDSAVDVQLIITKTDTGEDKVTQDDIDYLAKVLQQRGYDAPKVFRVSAKENTGIEDLRNELIAHAARSENVAEPASPLRNEFPKSYKEITDLHSSEEDKVIALLRDYTKGTTPVLASLSLLAHGHFNRHHTSLVRAKLKEYDNNEIGYKDVLDLLDKNLENLEKNPNGSLARRLSYIENFLIKTTDQTQGEEFRPLL